MSRMLEALVFDGSAFAGGTGSFRGECDHREEVAGAADSGERPDLPPSVVDLLLEIADRERHSGVGPLPDSRFAETLHRALSELRMPPVRHFLNRLERIAWRSFLALDEKHASPAPTMHRREVTLASAPGSSIAGDANRGDGSSVGCCVIAGEAGRALLPVVDRAALGDWRALPVGTRVSSNWDRPLGWIGATLVAADPVEPGPEV